MEKLLLTNVQNMNNNQYMIVHVKDGEIKYVIPSSKIIGFLTFGISKFFTSKYIIVTGEKNDLNTNKINKIKEILNYFDSYCEIYDELK